MKYEMENREDRSKRVKYKTLQDVLSEIVKEGDLNEEFVVYEYEGKKTTGVYLMRNGENAILIEAW